MRVVGLLAFLVALGCWAVASPVGASPDEDFQLASIWCAHGIETGVCEAGASPETRRVPAELLRSTTCEAFDPQETAACRAEPSTLVGMVETGRGNFAGSYPPVFYWVAGLFVGESVNGSVVVIRLVNAALYVGLIAAIYLALPFRLRRPLIAGALLTAVPLGMFIVPSVSPSSWAMLSAATVLVSVLGFLTAESAQRRAMLALLSAVSMLLGVGARADAAIFGSIAIGAALILAGPIARRHPRLLIFPAVLVVAAVLAFVSVGRSSAAAAWSVPTIVEAVPGPWSGALGQWGLGWLDIQLPSIVWVTAWSVYAGTLFVAVVNAGRRGWLAVGLVGLAAVAIPAYIESARGSGVQARYILPLLTILIATAAVRLSGPVLVVTRGQRWIVVVALSLANAFALQTNIRYATGVDSNELDLNKGVQWWWPISISPLVVWIAGSVMFAVGAYVLSAEFTSPDRRRAEPDDVDDGASKRELSAASG